MAKQTQSPFGVVIDTREQLPYTFTAIHADAVVGGGVIHVPIRHLALHAGDYSIDGYVRMVTVERKTLSDLAGTLTRGRKRFTAEMERLREYDAAWVVIEGSLTDIFRGLPLASQVRPKSILRSWMFWSLRYPRVHWIDCPSREFAEGVTYQLLRTWWRERIEGPAKEARKQRASEWLGPSDLARIDRQRDVAQLDRLAEG
jgi:DNA excision repair protein ERCC-4